MADEKEKDAGPHEPEAPVLKRRKRINVFAGLLCLLAAGLCIFYIWHKHNSSKPAEDVPSAVAVVDMDKLVEAHPGYAKLQTLEAEKLVLAARLKSYALDARSERASQDLNPAADVFSEVLDQQDNLRDIQSRQQLKEETAAKENELRNAIADERNQAVQKINDRYYNEILNCTIKLDNAKNLRLTKQEQDELLNRLDELKKERGRAVFELEQQFNLRVAKELVQWRMQREKEMGLGNAAAHQSDAADSAQRQQAERMRDAQYVQDRLQLMNARRKDSIRLLVVLHTKDNEIALLKKSILRDISSKAAKVAIKKHLKLVVANGRLNRDSFSKAGSSPFEQHVFGGIAVGVDAEDITDDILAELKADEQSKNDFDRNGASDAGQHNARAADDEYRKE